MNDHKDPDIAGSLLPNISMFESERERSRALLNALSKILSDACDINEAAHIAYDAMAKYNHDYERSVMEYNNKVKRY